MGITTGRRYVLTASHVIGALATGSNDTDEVITNALGPVPTASSHVGFTRGSAPEAAVFFCPVDAAVADLAPSVRRSRDAGQGKIGADYYDPYDPSILGLQVAKVGAKSGTTLGLVDETGAFTVQCRYGPILYPFGYFVIGEDEGIPFTLPGDSGALVTDLADRPLAMVVAMDPPAGNPGARSFCIPIAFIVEALDVRLIGPCRWPFSGVPDRPL
jgi:hypothetical protein